MLKSLTKNFPNANFEQKCLAIAHSYFWRSFFERMLESYYPGDDAPNDLLTLLTPQDQTSQIFANISQHIAYVTQSTYNDPPSDKNVKQGLLSIEGYGNFPYLLIHDDGGKYVSTETIFANPKQTLETDYTFKQTLINPKPPEEPQEK